MTEEIKRRIKIFENVLNKVPEIVYAGDPVLRQQAKEVSFDEGVRIAKQMEGVLLRTREITGFGRGLAAPQVGINKAVFVTCVNDETGVFINPKIVEKSDSTNFYKELCLSAGIVAADVERAEWIVMEWTDVEGVKHSEKFDSFLSRLYQHEEAHLRGRLNLDDACDGSIEFLTFDPLEEKLRQSR